MKNDIARQNHRHSKTDRFYDSVDDIYRFRFNLKFVLFLMIMSWLSRAFAESWPKDNKCEEDLAWTQNKFVDGYPAGSACFDYCEYGLHSRVHEVICGMLNDKGISLDEIRIDEILDLTSEQLSRFSEIRTEYSLYSMVKSKETPIKFLLSLPSEEFDYFANFYHERVIGLSRFVHQGKLSLDRALTMTHVLPNKAYWSYS